MVEGDPRVGSPFAICVRLAYLAVNNSTCAGRVVYNWRAYIRAEKGICGFDIRYLGAFHDFEIGIAWFFRKNIFGQTVNKVLTFGIMIPIYRVGPAVWPEGGCAMLPSFRVRVRTTE